MADSSGGADDADSDVVERTFDPAQADPTMDVTETVAELSGRDSDELTPLYGCIDDVAEHVYTNPPDPEAEIAVSFNYEGFRITLYQDGRATFRELS